MKKIYLLGMVFLLSGCVSTVWVSEKSDSDSLFEYKSVKGIPFYTKKEVFDQTTVYSQSWVEVTLKVDRKLVDNSGNDPKNLGSNSQSFIRNVELKDYALFDEVKTSVITNEKIDNAIVNDIINKFLQVKGVTDFDSIKEVMLSNSVISKWVVDEKSEYYLNAPLPWFGSSNLTQEINDNGTLSKVISNPDAKLSEGITSLIPFKDFLSAKYVDPLLSDDENNISDSSDTTKALFSTFALDPNILLPDNKKLDVIYTISITAVNTGYVYSFSGRTKDKPSGEKIGFDNKGGVFTRELIPKNSPNNENDGSESDSSPQINISGTITLPKEE